MSKDSGYSSIIGYSGLGNINLPKMQQKITTIREIITKTFTPKSGDQILVAGCGDGTEAVLFEKAFKLPVTGVDVSLDEEVVQVGGNVKLIRGDLSRTQMTDNQFSLVYSYHVLEHVSDHMAVLREMGRIMRDDGLLFIGFPNKNRLVGYIGSHDNISIGKKILWNLNDYKYKLIGRYENRLGAHAGFRRAIEFVTRK